MIDVPEGLRILVGRTSRRGVLAKLGRGLMGAALLTVVRPAALAAGAPPEPNAPCCSGGGNCSLCGGCGSQPCGATGGSCCPDCIGPFCSVQTGGTCPSGTSYGWWWYCCRADGLYICQDCCSSPGVRSCTSKGFISSAC